MTVSLWKLTTESTRSVVDADVRIWCASDHPEAQNDELAYYPNVRDPTGQVVSDGVLRLYGNTVTSPETDCRHVGDGPRTRERVQLTGGTCC